MLLVPDWAVVVPPTGLLPELTTGPSLNDVTLVEKLLSFPPVKS